MKDLLSEIQSCNICSEVLPHPPNPVLSVKKNSKIWIVGQAPGKRVHESGIPWDDASGNRLREWLKVDKDTFYDARNFGIIPMGFCYPGKGKSGDLPPRPECAKAWHQKLKDAMDEPELILLIGQYAQKHYLGERFKENLTETVKQYHEYLPKYLPLPHPSPRNRFWFSKNLWFDDVLDYLPKRISQLLS
jgi:uracil-DNA glycosylase